MSRPTSPWGVGGLVNFVFSLPKPPLSSRSSANSISSSTSSGSSTGSSSATNRISGSSNTCTLRYQNISQFTVVACAVSLCASLPPVSRQLSSWASLLVGLVGMREASAGILDASRIPTSPSRNDAQESWRQKGRRDAHSEQARATTVNWDISGSEGCGCCCWSCCCCWCCCWWCCFCWCC